jgi:hypothetical protein
VYTGFENSLGMYVHSQGNITDVFLPFKMETRADQNVQPLIAFPRIEKTFLLKVFFPN